MNLHFVLSRKLLAALLAPVTALLLVLFIQHSIWISASAGQKTITITVHQDSNVRIPIKVNKPLPPSVCITYKELRDINFLHKSIRSRLCNGVAAYSIVDSAFPLCELQHRLPSLITEQVKANSFRSHIQSPLTQRSVPCFVYNNSDAISNHIRDEHIFEKNIVKKLLTTIKRFDEKSPVTFLDIGSNIGVFTLTALDSGVPVVALDANIRNLLRIKLSAESAHRTHQLRLLWNFISSDVSLMYLNFPRDCNVGGATKFGRAVTDTVPVMSTTADAIVSCIQTQTVIMKVDIEGGEADFFKSASQLFKKFHVPVVFMEWLQRHMTAAERTFLTEFFQNRNYSPRSVKDFRQRVNIADPKLSTDLVWIRDDVLE